MSLSYLNKLFLSLLFLGFISSSGKTNDPIVKFVPAENKYFIGRQEILDNIFSQLQNDDSKIIVLQGLSGFGKSQIAKQYVYEHSNNYDVIWWFKGHQYLESQFKNLALELENHLDICKSQKLSEMQPVKLINSLKDILKKERLKCLFIFDDIDDFDDIKSCPLFFLEKNIHVFITTKNANFSTDAISIKPFLRVESLSYIDLFLPNALPQLQNDLANQLEDCPFSLAFAINYIRSYPGMTIDLYLKKHVAENESSLSVFKTATKKLGNPLDGYEKNLYITLKINFEKLKQTSPNAFQLMGFLSLLNHDFISMNDIKLWLKAKNIDHSPLELINIINQNSFLDLSSSKQKGYLGMHTLIQKTMKNFLSTIDKKKLIDEAVHILMPNFLGDTDYNVKTLIKNIGPVFHAIQISKEAYKLKHHTANLAILRVKLFNFILCALRDEIKSKIILKHLEEDLDNGIILPDEEKILYYIDKSLYISMFFNDYQKSITYALKASQLFEKMENVSKEKIRLIANLIQYYSFTGNLDKCEELIKQGKELIPLTHSIAYNSLFIYATTLYLLDKGDTQMVIELINENKNNLDLLEIHPSIRFYILNQFAEALIKQNKYKQAQDIIILSEKYGREFYANEDNTFFACLKTLKALNLFSQSSKFPISEDLLKQSLATYEKVFTGKDKYRKQAFSHLALGKLYYLHKYYLKAKDQFVLSEQIFDKILQYKKIDDLSELYKAFSILGVDIKDETLTNVYLKKQINIFGIDHPNTKEITLYIDSKDLSLPL